MSLLRACNDILRHRALDHRLRRCFVAHCHFMHALAHLPGIFVMSARCPADDWCFRRDVVRIFLYPEQQDGVSEGTCGCFLNVWAALSTIGERRPRTENREHTLLAN